MACSCDTLSLFWCFNDVSVTTPLFSSVTTKWCECECVFIYFHVSSSVHSHQSVNRRESFQQQKPHKNIYFIAWRELRLGKSVCWYWKFFIIFCFSFFCWLSHFTQTCHISKFDPIVKCIRRDGQAFYSYFFPNKK